MEWRIKLESKTGWGEVTEGEIATLTRRVTATTDEDIGLSLAESKAILSTLQRATITGQIDEYVACAQICRSCLEFLPVRDRRTRKIQTLFGTVEVCAPRIRVCACVNHLGLRDLSISPLAELLPDRCTPELCRLQAELGARMSYREAGRFMSSLLPCSPPKHSSISNRLARVADDLDARDREITCEPRLPTQTNMKGDALTPPVTVIIDGAHIRTVPATQSRLVDVTVGKALGADGTSRRFGLAPRGAAAPSVTLRAALITQGWRPGSAVTVISDGEPALRNLVKASTGEEVTHILDWWHLSIRVRHIEQTVQGMETSETPAHPTILDAAIQAERLRHLLWNGYAAEASRELFSLLGRADAIAELPGPLIRSAPGSFGAIAMSSRPTSRTTRGRSSIIRAGTDQRSRLRLPQQKDVSMRSRTFGWRRSGACVGPQRGRIGSQPYEPQCLIPASLAKSQSTAGPLNPPRFLTLPV
jgi:hypothetical protein